MARREPQRHEYITALHFLLQSEYEKRVASIVEQSWFFFSEESEGKEGVVGQGGGYRVSEREVMCAGGVPEVHRSQEI